MGFGNQVSDWNQVFLSITRTTLRITSSSSSSKIKILAPKAPILGFFFRISGNFAENGCFRARAFGGLSFGPARSYYYPARIFWHVFIWDHGTGMFGLKGVGIVVLTSRTVCCCQMESFLGYMS